MGSLMEPYDIKHGLPMMGMVLFSEVALNHYCCKTYLMHKTLINKEATFIYGYVSLPNLMTIDKHEVYRLTCH